MEPTQKSFYFFFKLSLKTSAKLNLTNHKRNPQSSTPAQDKISMRRPKELNIRNATVSIKPHKYEYNRLQNIFVPQASIFGQVNKSVKTFASLKSKSK